MANQLNFTPNYGFGDGSFAAGARATFFLSGTTTPVTTYSDEALTVPHPSPLEADASGVFPTVWAATGQNIKAVVTNSVGASLYTLDKVILGNVDQGAAASLSFAPTPDNPADNVQDAIENNTAVTAALPDLSDTALSGAANQFLGVNDVGDALILRSVNRWGNAVSASGVDFDDFNISGGQFRIDNNMNNGPLGGAGTQHDGMLTVAVDNAGATDQFFEQTFTTGFGQRYIRNGTVGPSISVWTEWAEVKTVTASALPDIAPLGGARITFDGESGGGILKQTNIASFSRASTGVYSVTFSQNMPDTNYTIIGSVRSPGTDAARTVAPGLSDAKTVSGCTFRTVLTFGGTGADDVFDSPEVSVLFIA